MTDLNLQQDILENGLSVFEAHTNDPHQKLKGRISYPIDEYILLGLEPEYDEDVADMYNDLDFSGPDEYFRLDQIQPDDYDYDTRDQEVDFFEEDLDPAGGHGLSSHI